MTPSMRRSRVLELLRAGELVCSTKVNLADPRAVEIAAISGFPCVWTCLEHVANDWSAIEAQVWAAKAHDVDLLVRVARGPYSDYVLPLELDAAGIMVPHVMGLADAQDVVRMTRFHPIGRRPIDGGNADAAYAAVEFIQYLQEANRERFICLQIEDPEPLDELEAIAALEGVDMLFWGPGDFSHAIGCPAQWDHPRILEGRRAVADACARHSKFAGTVGGVAPWATLVEEGYRFINLGSDILALGAYWRDLAAQFKALCAGLQA